MLQSDEHQEYRARVHETNIKYANDFSIWIGSKGLVEKTVDKHIGNVEFFVYEYLSDERLNKVNNATGSVDMFLGHWFIRKMSWSNESWIKTTASSLKKFYEFMLEMGYIEQREFDTLKLTIKKNLPVWLERVRCYRDPDIDDMADNYGY